MEVQRLGAGIEILLCKKKERRHLRTSHVSNKEGSILQLALPARCAVASDEKTAPVSYSKQPGPLFINMNQQPRVTGHLKKINSTREKRQDVQIELLVL